LFVRQKVITKGITFWDHDHVTKRYVVIIDLLLSRCLDLILDILHFLSEKDLCLVRQLSHELKVLADCDQVWKPRVKRLVNIQDPKDIALGETWKFTFESLGNPSPNMLYAYI
jgi:hypothetical protein